jgi:hypothetical protein
MSARTARTPDSLTVNAAYPDCQPNVVSLLLVHPLRRIRLHQPHRIGDGKHGRKLDECVEMIGRSTHDDCDSVRFANDAADVGVENPRTSLLIDGSRPFVPKITWKRRFVNVWAMMTPFFRRSAAHYRDAVRVPTARAVGFILVPLRGFTRIPVSCLLRVLKNC